MPQDLALSLTALLEDAARAHRAAFLNVDRQDPTWAAWYAAFIHHTVETLLGRHVALERLAELLTEVERCRGGLDAEHWAPRCGSYLAERL